MNQIYGDNEKSCRRERQVSLYTRTQQTTLGYVNMNLRMRSISVQEMIYQISITLNSIVLFPNVEPKLQSLQNADHKCSITH